MQKEMKSDEFRKLLEEPYLFHLHTRYTDGQLDAIDYFRFAKEHGVKTLVFTEHVRRDLKYDFSAFVSEIRTIALDYPEVKAVIGAEAKILPEGELDISEETLKQIDVLCFACHGFPDDNALYLRSFRNLLTSGEWKDKIRVFVHPGRYLKRRRIEDPEMWNALNELLLLGADNSVFIEENKRENLPPEIQVVPEEWRIVGYDIHHESGLENWLKGEK